MNVKRCYLCIMAERIVEHPENSNRKYYIRCRLDHNDHAPCSGCKDFNEKRVSTNGRTYSLEKNY